MTGASIGLHPANLKARGSGSPKTEACKLVSHWHGMRNLTRKARSCCAFCCAAAGSLPVAESPRAP
jgi:hypothetical protein